MKTYVLLGSVAVALGTLALAQGEKKGQGQGAQAIEAKWMEFAKPGAAHKVLDGKVGKWNMTVKIYTAPGQPPEESKATSEQKWILDGRFLEDTTEGNFMGQPFHGRGTLGYDNLKRKYVYSWVDTAGTGIYVGEGTYDAAAKTFTYTGEAPDPVQGKYVKSRGTETQVDLDHWIAKSWQVGADGKEFLSMEFHYERAK